MRIYANWCKRPGSASHEMSNNWPLHLASDSHSKLPLYNQRLNTLVVVGSHSEVRLYHVQPIVTDTPVETGTREGGHRHHEDLTLPLYLRPSW